MGEKLKALLDEYESKMSKIETEEVAMILGNGVNKTYLEKIVEYLRLKREAKNEINEVKEIKLTKEIIIEEEGQKIVLVLEKEAPALFIKDIIEHNKEFPDQKIVSRSKKSRAITDINKVNRILNGYIRINNPSTIRARTFVHYVTLDSYGKQAFFRGGCVIKNNEENIMIMRKKVFFYIPKQKIREDGSIFQTVFFKKHDFSEDEFSPVSKMFNNIQREIDRTHKN